jgi:hypothetical protein
MKKKFVKFLTNTAEKRYRNIIYKPTINREKFEGFKVENNINKFKK